MLVDSVDRDQMDNAKLARMHPEAYECKMKARMEYDPVKDLINLFKNLLAKMAGQNLKAFWRLNNVWTLSFLDLFL